MIDNKKIEEAARVASIKMYDLPDGDPVISNHFEDGFKAGIDWFLKNLWHSANEEPKIDKGLLVQNHKGVTLLVWSTEDDIAWCEKAADFNVTRWLYIEDLMKGGE